MAKDTKGKIIAATRLMIENNGIDSFSMRTLGNEIGLSRSAVYRHFKNKDDLLAAITIENITILYDKIENSIQSIQDPKEKIILALKIYLDFGVTNSEYYNLMLQKQWDTLEYPALHNSAFKFYQILTTCIEELKKQDIGLTQLTKDITAIIAIFAHGLVELNIAGHQETEKGFNDSDILIKTFLASIL